MANIEEALTTYLLAQTELTDYIDRRMKADYLPEGSDFPALVWTNTSDDKLHGLSGQNSLESPTMQFTVYAVTRAEIRTIAEILKTLLADYQGTMDGVEVQYIKLLDEYTATELIADGTTKINMIDLEFEVNFTKE